MRIVGRVQMDPSHGGRLIPLKKLDRNSVLTTRWVRRSTAEAKKTHHSFTDTGPTEPTPQESPEEKTARLEREEKARQERAEREAREAEARETRRKTEEEDRARRAEADRKLAEERAAKKKAREEFEYPYDVPPEAVHPGDMTEDAVYSVWMRNRGNDTWRVATMPDQPGRKLEYSGNSLLNTSRGNVEQWQALIDAHLAEGQEIVYVPHGAIPKTAAETVEVEGGARVAEDLPPDFLGLDVEKIPHTKVEGRWGTDYKPKVDDDPFLTEIGFWDAIGSDWARGFFLSQVGRGIEYDRLSDRVRGFYGGIFRNLASWWTDLNDDERERFVRDYVKPDRQPGRQKAVRDERHEDADFELPPGMEPLAEKGYALHAYQKKAANFSVKHAPRSILAMEMGLGKTLTAIAIFMRLRAAGECDRMLITAPLSAHGAWQEHFEDFTTGLRVQYLTGATVAQRKKAYAAFERGELDVLVISPDTVAVRTKKSKEAADLDALPVGHEVTWTDDLRRERNAYKNADGTWTTNMSSGNSAADVFRSARGAVAFEDPAGDATILSEIMAKHGPKVLRVADEVHKFKSPEAARSKGFWKAVTAHDGRVIGMTGTPKPNGAADFYHVVDHIAPGALGNDLREFGRRYGYLDERGEVVGFRPEKLPQLYLDHANVMFARTTDDPDSRINLPERLDVAPRIPMDDTQEQIQRQLIRYMAIRQAAAAEMRAMERGEFVFPANQEKLEAAKRGDFGPIERAAAKAAPWDSQGVLLRWSQLAIDPTALDEQFAEDFPGYESPKLQAVAEATIQHLTQQPETGAVVFCEFRSGISAMRRALEKRGVAPDKIAVYHGGTNRKERTEIQRALNSGEIKVLLGQTASLETGANLQKRANFVAHLNTPWAPDRLTQSTARVHRQGQRRKVTVFRPVGSEVEALIERTVSRKILESKQVTGKDMQAEAAVAKSMKRGTRERLDAAGLAATLGISPELLAKNQGEKIAMPKADAMERIAQAAWEDAHLRQYFLPKYAAENGQDAADAAMAAIGRLRKKKPKAELDELIAEATGGTLDL